MFSKFALVTIGVLLASGPALADKHDKAPPQAQRPAPRPAPRQRDPMELVMNAGPDALEGLFGAPRLDVAEGDARKLQFAGIPCVLDVYLYPPEGGGEPRVTWVEARRASDARDVDKGACINALRKR